MDAQKPTSVFVRLYGAGPFDENNPQDQLGETARRAVLQAAEKAICSVRSGADMPYVIGGLLVGIVQLVQAATNQSDEDDAAIRASILQLTPWAVDMARSVSGKEPLANA
jgi:hypothetical protein